ncbi:replicative DNA helicase [Megalodesulfovibrio gigas]|uniref:replicative DNA helicase n=1 Tax=Megalodesulfovibrio gigas TaxID=879 RepID=UPI0004195D9F|nr:replicative DNA helicase [Megalodesulfovibrio gigas]
MDVLPGDVRKHPPHNLEAEQSVLGGVLIKAVTLSSIAEVVSADDFYYPQHRFIYQACLELSGRNLPVDMVSVAEHLRREKKLDDAGGPTYLAELSESVIGAANAYYHATIIRDKSLQRQLIEAGSKIVSESFEPRPEINELLEFAEKTVFDISQRQVGSSITPANDLVRLVFDELTARFENKQAVTGVPTGYHKLNELTAGLQPTDLIIIAGRPAMGKTAFALNVCMRAAIQGGTSTVVFSLEMGKEQLMQRMLCAWGKVDLSKMRRGNINDEDWTKLHAAADHFSRANLFIDDTPALSVTELRGRCRRLKREKNLGLVVVDYLQLMRASRRIDSREQEISEISRSLKALAKELHLPVVALSQLNRKLEERGDKRPQLSDLRESGAIEQDADVIMFLYRDEVYNKREDNPKRGVAEVIIGKQRNGPLGVVELAYVGAYTAFEELEDRYSGYEPQGAAS